MLVCLGVKGYYPFGGLTQVITMSYSINEFLRRFLAAISDFECFRLFQCFRHFRHFPSFKNFLELLSSRAFRWYFWASCDVIVLLATLESFVSKLRELSVIILVELSLVYFLNFFVTFWENHEFLVILKNYEFLRILRNYESIETFWVYWVFWIIT